MSAIETEDLTKDYKVGFWRPRPYRALDGLTLSVSEGELFGFLGPNGAGKSTTLKLLMKLIFPTKGDARILGQPVGDIRVLRRIGFLAENPYYYDYLTAEELLTYFASLFGLRGPARTARVSQVLDEVGIGAERRMRLRSFSKGMIQRVGIAQAIVNEPEVVFLDEPMSGLDPIGRREVRQLMLGLRDRGCTVFFSSHILSDAEALCTRVAIVAGGRLVSVGCLSDILGFHVRGWELVVDHLPPHLQAQIGSSLQRVAALPDGRVAIELPSEPSPDALLQQLRGHGVRVVSLNPIRQTLEDYFVRAVSSAPTRERVAL